MNPISSVMQAVGLFSYLMGVGAQAANLRRQWRPPVQTAQAQQCPLGYMQVIMDGPHPVGYEFNVETEHGKRQAMVISSQPPLACAPK